MNNETKTNGDPVERGVGRRKFLGVTIGGGAAILAGGSSVLFSTASNAAASAGADSVFKLGGDLPVNRLGFGAMRITGDGIWGWPPNRDEALKVLRRMRTGRKQANCSSPKRSILTRKDWSLPPKAVSPDPDPASGCRTAGRNT